ncbi:hypothetical protein PGB90_009416 [Kerria lacca]
MKYFVKLLKESLKNEDPLSIRLTTTVKFFFFFFKQIYWDSSYKYNALFSINKNRRSSSNVVEIAFISIKNKNCKKF